MEEWWDGGRRRDGGIEDEEARGRVGKGRGRKAGRHHHLCHYRVDGVVNTGGE